MASRNYQQFLSLGDYEELDFLPRAGFGGRAPAVCVMDEMRGQQRLGWDVSKSEFAQGSACSTADGMISFLPNAYIAHECYLNTC